LLLAGASLCGASSVKTSTIPTCRLLLLLKKRADPGLNIEYPDRKLQFLRGF
jgi:hypothetical protein